MRICLAKVCVMVVTVCSCVQCAPVNHMGCLSPDPRLSEGHCPRDFSCPRVTLRKGERRVCHMVAVHVRSVRTQTHTQMQLCRRALMRGTHTQDAHLHEQCEQTAYTRAHNEHTA